VKQLYIISINSVFKGADSLAFNSDVMELQMEITEIHKNECMEGNYSSFLA